LQQRVQLQRFRATGEDAVSRKPWFCVRITRNVSDKLLTAYGYITLESDRLLKQTWKVCAIRKNGFQNLTIWRVLSLHVLIDQFKLRQANWFHVPMPWPWKKHSVDKRELSHTKRFQRKAI